MATRKVSKSPTRAIAKEYFDHGKNLRTSFATGLELLDGPESAAFEAALERLSESDPSTADAVDAYFSKLLDCITALNEALYHECERRAIAPKLARSGTARKGASGRAANPKVAAKAAAKAQALEFWKERHAGKHPKLRTVEQYATEVMRRWPILTSSKVICGWSAKWSRDLREGRTPAC